MSAAPSFDADVVILGYGPTGLAASLALGAAGVRTVALERDEAIYPRARAVTVNDWTMRLFQSVGLDADLARDMEPTGKLRWLTYDRQELMRIELPPSTMGPHPRSYAIYQPTMEQTLRRGALRFRDHLEVRYGTNVKDVVQDESGVTVTYEDVKTGHRSTVRARFALACDGGASEVRTRLDIPMSGSTENTRWVVIDARVKRWWPERHLLTFWSDKKRPVVDISLAGGNHRWEFPLEEHESESDFATHGQLWRLLESLGVKREYVDIHQHAFYRHHVRHADRWRAGRVFLLGDAAHLMPPWAGAGMQSGIRDAFDLAWKLREVLAGRLPPALLDSYQTERAPNVAMWTGFSMHLGRAIKQELTEAEIAADAAAGPAANPLLAMPALVAGWLRGQPGPESAVGKMIPQPRAASASGKLGWLDELLGRDFVILGDDVDPATLLEPHEKGAWDRLGARFVAVRPPTAASQTDSDIIDIDGTLLGWLRAHRTRAVALRPDRFVAAAEGSGLGVPDC